MNILPFYKKIRLFCFTFLSVVAFFALERLCHLATDGFSMLRVLNPLPKDPEFSPPQLSTKDLLEIKKITSQPFHYLSCGAQSYVFLSEDGSYVLKLMKFHHRRVLPWLLMIPFPKALAYYKEGKIRRKEHCLKRMLTSYVVAYDKLKEETGLIYHHLQDTSCFNKSLLFYDKIGNPHKIELDHTAFLLQKKGMSTNDMLKSLTEKKEIQKAEKLLKELISLSINRSKKGIKDRDFKFKSNLGFIDGKAAQIDLGSLSLDETQKDPKVYKQDVKHAGIIFYEFLKKDYPQLAESFYENLSSLN